MPSRFKTWPCCNSSASITTRRWNTIADSLKQTRTTRRRTLAWASRSNHLGKIEDALASLDRALSLDPTLEDVRVNREVMRREKAITD